MERPDTTETDSNEGVSQWNVEFQNRQSVIAVPQQLGRAAVQQVLQQESVARGHVNVVVVDDAEIRRLNRKFLQHDYATDVLSFCYEPPPDLDGELIIGGERAVCVAAQKRLPAQDEMIWYIIHGTLHLIGYDDATAAERAGMRAREAVAMQALGLTWPMEAREEDTE